MPSPHKRFLRQPTESPIITTCEKNGAKVPKSPKEQQSIRTGHTFGPVVVDEFVLTRPRGELDFYERQDVNREYLQRRAAGEVRDDRVEEVPLVDPTM